VELFSSALASFRELFYQINQISQYSGKEPVFKITTKGSRALTELSIPKTERQFKEFIENLFIVLFEGSGYGKRLPLKLDPKKTIIKIKELRNHYIHDQEHGKKNEIRRKFKLIGDIFQGIIGTRAPVKEEDWISATIEILNDVNNFLLEIVENYDNLYDYVDDEELNKHIKSFYEHDITIFPEEKVKFRTIEKSGPFSALADATIFIPHFSWRSPPQFGTTKAALHFSSKAFHAKLEDYKKFLNHVENLWKKKIPYVAREASELLPWSISCDEKLMYGSGIKNLIEAIKSIDIGIVTIFLIGTYGEDYSKTFFIIINNYWKYGIFRDNYFDIYLCNMPLNLKWIEEINDSIEILSTHNEKADSYSLKNYIYHFWRGERKDNIVKNLIGGIGRSGFDDEREYDQFDGLILENPFSENDFEFDKNSSWNTEDKKLECPSNSFKEIIMSITNHPPSIKEIKDGSFTGFVRPHIQHIIFDGYGHVIHALLFWGGALFKQD